MFHQTGLLAWSSPLTSTKQSLQGHGTFASFRSWLRQGGERQVTTLLRRRPEQFVAATGNFRNVFPRGCGSRRSLGVFVWLRARGSEARTTQVPCGSWSKNFRGSGAHKPRQWSWGYPLPELSVSAPITKIPEVEAGQELNISPVEMDMVTLPPPHFTLPALAETPTGTSSQELVSKAFPISCPPDPKSSSASLSLDQHLNKNPSLPSGSVSVQTVNQWCGDRISVLLTGL